MRVAAFALATALATVPSCDRKPAGPLRAPTQIVFQTARTGSLDVYAANPDGTDPFDITRLGGNETAPSLSPDGRWIVFVSDRHGYLQGTLDVVRIDGTGRRAMPVRGDAELPAWSPDGRRIAFVSTRNGNPDIYVVDVAGGHEHRVTATPGLDTHPSWSPDGRRLVFAGRRSGRSEIYVVGIATRRVRRLL